MTFTFYVYDALSVPLPEVFAKVYIHLQNPRNELNIKSFSQHTFICL